MIIGWLVGWLVGWFYSISTLVRLFNAKITLFLQVIVFKLVMIIIIIIIIIIKSC